MNDEEKGGKIIIIIFFFPSLLRDPGLDPFFLLDGLAIELLELWKPLDDLDAPVALLAVGLLEGISCEKQLLEVGELLEALKLAPLVDLVVGHVEHAELLEHGHAREPLDVVVRDPQLLQRVGHIRDTLNLFQLVAAQ